MRQSRKLANATDEVRRASGLRTLSGRWNYGVRSRRVASADGERAAQDVRQPRCGSETKTNALRTSSVTLVCLRTRVTAAPPLEALFCERPSNPAQDVPVRGIRLKVFHDEIMRGLLRPVTITAIESYKTHMPPGVGDFKIKLGVFFCRCNRIALF